MTKYYPVTEEELYQIKNECKYPKKESCQGCECENDDTGCSFSANVFIDEVMERMDPLEVLNKLMEKDLKNNEEFERHSYDMAMRQGDRRYYLEFIERLQENPQEVISEGKKEGWLK